MAETNNTESQEESKPVAEQNGTSAVESAAAPESEVKSVVVKKPEEQVVAEAKAEEKVAEGEAKAEEVKTEEKMEVDEAKTEEKVEEAKTEAKIEEPKTEAKVEETKSEEKVEEPKTEAKPEEKVEEAKTEEKVEEAKTEEKVEEAKTEEKVEETKTEEKVEETKTEEKVEEAKTEEVKLNGEAAAAPASKEKTSEPPTEELLGKIKRQIEFYFGDTNMQRDKFLVEQTKLDEGWIPMTVMLNFKMLANLSKDVDVILKALEGNELMEISEDRKKIRRSPSKPLPSYDQEYRKAQEARTVYLKGFPLDATLEQLKAHFDSFFPDAVESLIMRKYKKDKDHFFKGSIFLQFKNLEDAKALIEQESVKYNDKPLLKMWSAEYAAVKEHEREEFRLKKLQQKTKAEKANDAKEAKMKEIKLPKGCVMHFSGVPNTTKREPIKERLVELEAEVAYIDFNIGDVEGHIRLQGENAAVEFMKKLESNVLKVGDMDVTLKLLEGEEEEAYLKKTVESMASNKTNRRNDRGRGGRRGHKRRHSPHRHSNAKAARVDDS